jgi:hypothetical protein
MDVLYEKCKHFLCNFNYPSVYKSLFKKFAIFLVVQIINNTLEYLDFYHKSVELFWGMVCFWIFFDSVGIVQESKVLELKNHDLTEKYALLLKLYHKEQKMALVLRELELTRQEQCAMLKQFQQIHSDLNIVKCILHRKSLQAEKHFKISNSQSPPSLAPSPSFTFKVEISTETEDNNALDDNNELLREELKNIEPPRIKKSNSWSDSSLSVIPPLQALRASSETIT